MIKLIRTNSEHPDFVALVKLLDAELAERDGEDNAFYSQFNSIESLNQVVLAYEGDQALACGAFKASAADAVEIKRMYSVHKARGKRIATQVLAELEKWAKELGYQRMLLETGLRQPEAIRLYERNNYKLIPNFEPYVGVDNSRCFAKSI